LSGQHCNFLSNSILSFFAFLILLAGPQLDPALTPQKASKPELPKINENACPFEGCQFDAWTATDEVQIYSTWKSDRKPIAKAAKGELVTTITGIHITFEPDEIQVTAPIPEYGLNPGDTIFGYMRLGEGFFSAWFNGGFRRQRCERFRVREEVQCKTTQVRPL
jgi:hypothetical protein